MLASETLMRIMKSKMRLLALLIFSIAFPSVEMAQSGKSAIEYQSLLNMRYYEADGGFLVDDLQMVFPPEGNQKLSFIITRNTGEEVARVPLRSEGIRTF